MSEELNEIGLQTDPDPTDAAIISLLQKKYLFSVSFPTVGNDKLKKISSDNYSNSNKLQNSKESPQSPLINGTTTSTTTTTLSLQNTLTSTNDNKTLKDSIGSSSSATKTIYVPPQRRVDNYKDNIEESDSFSKQHVKERPLYKIPQRSSSFNKEENYLTTNKGAWNAVPSQQPTKNDERFMPIPPQQSINRNDTWDVAISHQLTKKDDWITSAPPQQSTQQSTSQVPWGTATTDLVAGNLNSNNNWLKQASAFKEELGTKNTATGNESIERPPRDNYNERYSNNNNGYEYQAYGNSDDRNNNYNDFRSRNKDDMTCHKCNDTGHRAFECSNELTLRISEGEAWEKMMKADAEKNIEDFKEMFEHYSKAAADETFQTIETKLRKAGCNTKIIALEREAIPFRKCLMDLQGNKEKRYLTILTMTDPNKLPKSSGNRARDPEENFMWLAESGFMKDDHSSPICYNCKHKGHVSKDCIEPRKEYKRTYLACQNCESTEHITKYCQEERRNYENRRGGDRGRQSGGRECYKCGSSDHLARDCNNDGGGGGESKSDSYYNNSNKIGGYGDYSSGGGGGFGGGGGYDTSTNFAASATTNINNEDDWKKAAESKWGVVENSVEGKLTGSAWKDNFVAQSDRTSSTWNNNNTSHGGYQNNTGNDAVPRW